MAIQPQDYPHVFRRYRKLNTEKRRTLQNLRKQLGVIDKRLTTLSQHIQDPRRPDDERSQIHESIKAAQYGRNQYLSEITRIKAQPSIVVNKDYIAEKYAEFSTICALPEVVSASIDSNDAINVIVRASYVHNGVRYDIGDWAIIFGDPDPLEAFKVIVYRQCLRTDWSRGKYPEYSFDDGSFCLGTNSSIIASHFGAGRYRQAIQLTIFALNSVNPGHEHLVPSAYFPYPQTPFMTGVPQWPHSMSGQMQSTS